jgi:hypothetical protein
MIRSIISTGVKIDVEDGRVNVASADGIAQKATSIIQN